LVPKLLNNRTAVTTTIYMLNVLIIDDDNDIRFGLNRIMGRLGYDVVEAESGEAGLAALASGKFDLVFCDVRFPGGMAGDEILRTINADYPDVKVVMMSCAMDYSVRTEMKELGAADAMQKPFFKEQCLETVNALFPPLRKVA